jgi:hypothetical protein
MKKKRTARILATRRKKRDRNFGYEIDENNEEKKNGPNLG